MRRLKLLLLITCLLALLAMTPALALTEQLVLRVSRNFGYSSGTGRIQGNFTMSVSGPADLQRVTFLIDGNPIAEASQAPFKVQFNTDQYALGVHTLSASGETGSGGELKSNVYRLEFVSAQTGWQAAGKIALPIIGIVMLVMLFTFLFPSISGRGKLVSLPAGAPRNYGALGGGICPKCGRPFAFHILSLNLLTGKFERCPYCGKWSIVRHASLDDLRRAEAAELEAAKAGELIPQASEEDLRKQLDDSRFQDQ